MIYVLTYRDTMYHKDHYDKRGKRTTKYYELKQGQLLTVCEAIQQFELTLDEIRNEYETFIVQVNRRHTYKDENNRRFVEEGYNNIWFVS